jgi:hypothetical protein
MPAPNPDHLLDQADGLIAPPRSGAPRQVNLRRAISNAYYSVFHAIAAEAADIFIGRMQRQSPMYELVYRSIDHKSLRKLSEDVKKPTMPERYSKYVPTGGLGPDLVAVATAIAELQEKRHRADYDPLFRVQMSDALLAVETSRTALARFRRANRNNRKVFLSLLVFAPR